MIPPDFARYLAFHYAAGAAIFSPDGTQIVINSPEAQRALEFYYGMYRDGIATTHTDAGAQWPGDGLAKDLADLVFEGNWIFPFLKDSAPDLQYGIAEMPAGPAGKATLGFTVSFSAFVDTKVPDAAWTVINYLTGPDGMLKWTSLGLAMPSRPGLAEAWLKQYPEREPYLKSGEYARACSSVSVGRRSTTTQAPSCRRCLPARRMCRPRYSAWRRPHGGESGSKAPLWRLRQPDQSTRGVIIRRPVFFRYRPAREG